MGLPQQVYVCAKEGSATYAVRGCDARAAVLRSGRQARLLGAHAV